MDKYSRESGTILLVVLILMLVIGGMTTALHSMAIASHRSSVQHLEREMAYQNARSGASYVMTQLNADKDYLDDLALPATMTMGNGTFVIESATPGEQSGDWTATITGGQGGATYSMGLAFGYNRVSIPPGIVTVGTGNPSDVTMNVTGDAVIASYDSTDMSYDPSDPGTSGNVDINGSVVTTGTVTIYGDLSASGTISTSASTDAISVTPGADSTPTPPIDDIVYDVLNSSSVSNDNGNLPSIFGAMWTPVTGTTYGDLIVTSGTYRVPAGTYRFRRLEVRDGAQVIFDTESAPARIAYIGSGKGTGTLNDLIVDGGSSISVDSGESYNGLLTVLAQDCDFTILNGSTFGQNLADPSSAGYSQIISAGGNTSSDVITASGGSTVYSRLYATAHALDIGAGSTWYGSGITRTIALTGAASTPANFIVDESIVGNSLTRTTTYSVNSRWYVIEPAN